MIGILAALLLPLHFTAPADTFGADGAGRARVSRDPVRSYVFLRLPDRSGNLSAPGNARARVTSRIELAKEWEGSGSQALVVRRRSP